MTGSTIVVHQLSESWRITYDGAQWLLESFHENDGWRGRACCSSLEALRRCLQIHVDGDIDPEVLAALGLVEQPRPGPLPAAAEQAGEAVQTAAVEQPSGAEQPRKRGRPRKARASKRMDRSATARAAACIGPRPNEVLTVIARLNAYWRVMVAHDGTRPTQWILQRFHDGAWRGRSYCRMRYALERCVQAHAGNVDPTARAIVAALPGHIDWTGAEVTIAS